MKIVYYQMKNGKRCEATATALHRKILEHLDQVEFAEDKDLDLRCGYPAHSRRKELYQAQPQLIELWDKRKSPEGNWINQYCITRAGRAALQELQAEMKGTR